MEHLVLNMDNSGGTSKSRAAFPQTADGDGYGHFAMFMSIDIPPAEGYNQNRTFCRKYGGFLWR